MTKKLALDRLAQESTPFTSNGLTVTDTTIEPAGIVGMRWRNDFRDGGSEPEHNGGQHSSFCIKIRQPNHSHEHEEPWQFLTDCPLTAIQLPAQFG